MPETTEITRKPESGVVKPVLVTEEKKKKQKQKLEPTKLDKLLIDLYYNETGENLIYW